MRVSVTAWSKTRLVLAAFILFALTVTMITATGLIVDAGPLQIWPQNPSVGL